MKIVLWTALCGLCAVAGHVLLGVVAAFLLLACVPVRREAGRGAAERELITTRG
ncbi:hypothetical protein [Amycolatopsis sp. FDAARGOS 1241]|uniref:hypothetical protein n=1 Tax=Amycolatopsis sp. FDAARGOS 1241 TaxID=2778070 RepID=UPI0019513717|nr:hypothetical protein [Amycolatopsis sp. FDAARGOS 1241]QRP49026.1 hypothetical protein I6J71_15230 [Amycolatopsis sp. FDAARGOS 1241]